ncbi:protein kinase [Kitasatospora sp. NPDC059648]|uniref:serine/threonine-protein kinase n=1 Tax=Kitasatospora sp. NPDC059648 TaxID=3346894 RepID=UPI0036A618A3
MQALAGLKPLDLGDPEVVGPYRLLARLGAGGMGRVYLARSPSGRPVAVKVIRAEFADDPEFRRRFRREVDTARAVGGDRTAPLLDADAEAALPWLATSYVCGPSLAGVVDRFGPLPEHTVQAVGVGLAEALVAIHGAGLIHRDLKPSNVLLAAAGPRLIDFGIARAVEGSDLTASGIVIGTPAFMSPEQAAGRPLGPASDVYSLGSVLVFAATGAGPHGHGANGAGMLYKVVHEPADVTGLPEPLLRIVSAMLAKDPAERPEPREIADRLLHGGATPPDGTSPTIRTAWLPAPLTGELARHAEAVAALHQPLRESAATAVDAGGDAARAPLEQEPAPAPGPAPGPEPEPASSEQRSRPSRRLFLVGGALIATGGGALWAVQRHQSTSRAGAKAPQGPVPTPRWHYPATNAPAGLVCAPATKTLVLPVGRGLVALDTDSGSARWAVPDYPVSYTVINDSTLYLYNGISADGYELSTGQHTWTLENAPGNPVAISGDVFCFTTGNAAVTIPSNLTGWSISRKKAVWNRTTNAGVITTAGGLVLMARNGWMTAVNCSDGTDKWIGNFPLPRSRDAFATDADGFYCTMDGTSNLYAGELDSGERRWSVTAPDKSDIRAVTAVNGTVYAVLSPPSPSAYGRVAAFSAKDGSVLWVYDSPRPLADRPPVLTGRTLALLASETDAPGVVAVDVGSHRTAWVFNTPPGKAKYPNGDLATDGRQIYLQHATDIYALPTT